MVALAMPSRESSEYHVPSISEPRAGDGFLATGASELDREWHHLAGIQGFSDILVRIDLVAG
jgi:hypothetical protein